MNYFELASNNFSSFIHEHNGEYDAFIKKIQSEQIANKIDWNHVFLADLPLLKEWNKSASSEEKGNFIIYCLHKYKIGTSGNGNDFSELLQVTKELINTLLKPSLLFNDVQIYQLYIAFFQNNKLDWHQLNYLNFGNFIKIIERNINNFGNDEDKIFFLIQLKETINGINASYDKKTWLQTLDKIESIIHANNNSGALRLVLFLGDDPFKLFGNETIGELDSSKIEYFNKLMDHAKKASGAKPSGTFLKDSEVLINEFGIEKFTKILHSWANFIINMKETDVTHTYESNGHTGTYNTIHFLSEINAEILKGFVWMCAHLNDIISIQLLTKLAERAYKKIPSKGPAAAGIGNAAISALFYSGIMDAIASLSRLKIKLTHSNAQKLIIGYLEEAAKKYNVTISALEDMAVDDFDLENGSRLFYFDDTTCKLEASASLKSELKWFKPDGNALKAPSSSVKEKFKAELKDIKALQKQLDQTISTQKERLDRMLRTIPKMDAVHFHKCFDGHELMSMIINNTIWNVWKGDDFQILIFSNKQWFDAENNIQDITEADFISLWHPVISKEEIVQSWRNYLIQFQLKQPIKQAFREIYLLTEAEINTKTYSNRMASHILKQHQYVSLAKHRNWKATLLGAWDSAQQDTAGLNIEGTEMRAEFWVNSVEADNQYNAAGIWSYISTDQIRFVTTNTNELIPLIEIPPIIFSEVMRDVDLFVGVASVGNDPNWIDNGGLPRFNNYWNTFSFGDLSELAKSRREILIGLIPRLKIAKIAQLTDKFLIIQGKLRTYKIHLGSTNILMEPNDQYLCIVPDRSAKNLTENLFIPFDDDSALSIILSKAFLLADDDKITDSVITSQIIRT